MSSTIWAAVNFCDVEGALQLGVVERGRADHLGALERQARQRHRLVQVERAGPHQPQRRGAGEGGARCVQLGEGGAVERSGPVPLAPLGAEGGVGQRWCGR